MTLDDIQAEWDKDCQIDDNYLGENSTATPKLHAKYIRLLVNARLKLTKLQSEYNILRKNKFRYYRGELSREELNELGWPQWQGIKPLKNEMDEFLTGDDDLNKIKMRIDYIEIMIYTLESIMGQIKSREWQIKNGITWKQFLAGM